MIFLNLGIQPLANDYPKITEVKKKEKKYKLLIDFDKKNKLVSIKKRILRGFLRDLREQRRVLKK